MATKKRTPSKALKVKAARKAVDGCGVRNLLEQQNRLAQQWRIVGELVKRRERAKVFISEEHQQALEDRLAGNHELASHMQCRSLAGAAFQIALAHKDMLTIPLCGEGYQPVRMRRAS